jgi:hypothetical protein
MENIFFLIVVAAIGLIRLLTYVAEQKKNKETARRNAAAPTTDPVNPAPRGAPQSEEERVRKFFEALGVPTTAEPPPRVKPQQVRPASAPKRKILPVDPFPKPRGRVVEPRPIAPLPSPEPPPLPSAIPPLPTLETTVFASVQQAQPEPSRSEFGVRDLDEDVPEEAFSHGGVRIAGAKNSLMPNDFSFPDRLATGQGLRDAIILREIFGPPRSMQPAERL